jgi:nucleotide-binding universal stress UspA family protein
MKKIIAAIDGLKYSDSTTSYAVHLASQTNAHLVGIFLDDFTYHSYKIMDLVGNEGLIEEKHSSLEEKDEGARKQAVHDFENACRDAGLNFTIHHDRSIAIQELLHESIYADLLVINRKETLTHYEEKLPTRFMRDLLSEVQCPVLVVPKNYETVDKVVLLYDGEPTSVYAIKMYSYLFPEWQSLDTEVISVKDVKQTLHVPDNYLMKEFMKRHFPKAEYTVLKGDPETEIIHNLKMQQQNVFVVLGAYKRGMVSRWFKSSMADILMQELNVPLFIAHNK